MSAVAAALPRPVAKPARTAEIALAIGVVAIISLLVVPLPAVILDLLLAASIASALVVLLVALSTKDPLEFSSFPAVLFILRYSALD